MFKQVSGLNWLDCQPENVRAHEFKNQDMTKITFLTFLLLVFFYSCSSSGLEEKENGFDFPEIVVKKNNRLIKLSDLKPFNTDSLRSQYSGFVIGKFGSNQKQVNLKDYDPNERPKFYSQIDLDSISGDGLQLLIDTNQFIIDPWYYYSANKEFLFHPVILLNENKNSKKVTTITRRVLLSQEIYFNDNWWVAINDPEIFNMCGDGAGEILLNQHEYVLLNAPVYSGKDRVKMRVRIKNGDNIYVSQPFFSNINLSQIYMSKNLKEINYKYLRKGSMGESYYERLPVFKLEKEP